MKVLLLAFCIPYFFFTLPQPKKVVKVKRVVRKVRMSEPIAYRVKSGSFECYAQGHYDK